MNTSIWEALDRIAFEQPILFCSAVTILFIILLIGAILLGRKTSRGESLSHSGELLGRVLGASALALVVERLGWLGPAGFAFAGTPESWAITIVALIYVAVAFPYALTRSITYKSRDSLAGRLIAMNAGSAALIEEVAFRGIILFVLVRAWEGSRQGVLGAVLVSSLFFSLVHLLNLLAGEPIGRIAPQAVWSFLGGVFFASLVIRGMSIWPAVLLHASANIAVRLNLQSRPDFRPSARAYARLAGLAFPLAIVGIALL
jgi:membrane protease YdiL (CAAX protease family)